MQLDWWTLALQTINLLVLVWLLGRFLFRPIARIVEERQATVTKALDEAKAMCEKAEQAEVAARDAAAKLAAERSATLDKAQAAAEDEKARLTGEARDEARKLIAQAEDEIGRMRKAAADADDKRASELAVDIAAHLFDRLPEDARVAGFAKGLADALAALPDEARGEIGGDGRPVTLKAARELTADELQSCRKAIASALGREVDVAVSVEPDLIAGLEIEAPHTIVRNSLRADLGRIAGELAHARTSDG